MKKRILPLALVILTLVNMVALGTMVYHRFSKSKTAACAEPCDGQFEQMRKALSLSTEQATKLDGCRKSFHTDLNILTDQLRTARTQLAILLAEASPNDTEINQSLLEIGRFQAAAQKRVISHLLAVKAFLDPDQQKMFFSIVSERFSASKIQPMAGRSIL